MFTFVIFPELFYLEKFKYLFSILIIIFTIHFNLLQETIFTSMGLDKLSSKR